MEVLYITVPYKTIYVGFICLVHIPLHSPKRPWLFQDSVHLTEGLMDFKHPEETPFVHFLSPWSNPLGPGIASGKLT